MSTILGLYAWHDASVCLLRDGQVSCLIEDERLTRLKHAVPLTMRGLWGQFNRRFGYVPWASLQYALESAGLGLDEVDRIVVQKGGIDWQAVLPLKDKRKLLQVSEPVDGVHHYCHALSGFYASPFESAAVLVVDGDGDVNAEGYECETGYFFADRQSAGREVFKNRYPALPLDLPGGVRGAHAGLGIMYEALSAVLGFVNTQIGMSDAGKTMGLAPYGKPTAELSERWVEADGFKLDFTRLLDFLLRSGLIKSVGFYDRTRALIQNEKSISQYAMDLAFKVQKELEDAMLHLAFELHKATGAKNLCIAGGVGLNSVANGLILAKGPFENVFVQPAAADNGQALGLAYYGALHERQTVRPIRHAFGGRPYPPSEVKALLDDAGLRYQELADDAALTQDAAKELLSSKIIGWWQGGSEYGPRALGHRSILADPRSPQMKDRINARVKFREAFRPFAPSVLKERAHEVFDFRGESPYMLIVAPVRPEWLDRVPAVAHVDGSARIQTVDVEVDPLYHLLISTFAQTSGVPVLVNTSFNLRGMPVVETHRDALQCFLYTDMDALYLGRFKVAPLTPDEVVPAIASGWHLVVETILKDGYERREAAFVHDELGKRVELDDADDAQWCARADGKTSLRTLLGGNLTDAQLEPSLRLVQSLLRAGAMKLRLGKLEL